MRSALPPLGLGTLAAFLTFGNVSTLSAGESNSANFKQTRSSLDGAGERKGSVSYTLDTSEAELALTTQTSSGYLLRNGLQTIYHYPGRIADLSCSTGPGINQASLGWTAPGNDAQDAGTSAKAYIIKQSSAASQSPAISDSLFNAAVSVTPAPPTPASQGTLQTMTADGLLTGTSYYFAMRAREADGIPGVLSVGCTVYLPDLSPPEPVADLFASGPPVEGRVDLTWTAPLEDSGVPIPKTRPVANYTLRIATFSADSVSSTTTWWNAAQDVAGEPTPVDPGSPQSMTLLTLDPGVTYYFAIKSQDLAGNISPIDTLSLVGGSPQAFAVVFDSAPAAPTGLIFTNIWPSSASFTWTAPPAFDLDFYRIHVDSTTPYDFADEYVLVVGAVSTSYTHTGLTPGNDYQYYVTAVDKGAPAFPGFALESSSSNFISIFGNLLKVKLESAAANAPQNTVTLNWTNPNDPPRFTLILRQAGAPPSANPIPSTAYSVGDVLGGATVVFNAGGGTFVDSGLALNTTWYYALFARDNMPQYSLGVTTAVLVDLRPLFAAGLSRQLSADKSQVTLSWSRVISEETGTLFADPQAPLPEELQGYYLYRSTSLWTQAARIATLAQSATTYTDAIGGLEYYYHVTAYDRYSQESEASMRIRALAGDVHALSADRRSLVRIENSLLGFLNGGNPEGQNLHVSAQTQSDTLPGKILFSTEFTTRKGDRGAKVGAVRFPEPKVWITFYYSGAGLKSAFALAASAGTEDVVIYWHNGADWVKVLGTVDKAQGSVTIQTEYLGPFQVRSVVRAQQVRLDKVFNRFLTPNGDRRNDSAVFKIENPSALDVSGKIFTVGGAFVSDMRLFSAPPACLATLKDCLEWDGRSNGQVVPGGVYIYQVEGEGNVFNGTVIVIK